MSAAQRLIRFTQKPLSDKWVAIVETLRYAVAFVPHPSRLRNSRTLWSLAHLFGFRPKPGVLFLGYVEAAIGFGESSRGLISALTETDLFFAIYPFNREVVKMRIIGPFMDKWYDRNGRYEVNVIEMSADGVPGALQELGWKAYHSYNILRTYWELARAPSEWGAWLMGIDEIWVPNKFVGDAFRFIFDGRITIVPPCVDIKSEINYEREAFDMDLGRFYFLFSFEYFSFPARKNPFGVLRAFRAAFPDQDERVGLVIKSTGGGGHPEVRAALLEAARQDRRIKIIDRTLSRDEILSLIGQSDCYVSLHRAEGFGLGMAEAMAFGIPVIGTNYSGNTEFLSDTTGFTVSYTLRAVRPGEYLFAEDQVWAEPDETAAAQVMRKVFDDPRERQSRAAAGKAFVEARYSRKTAGKIAERRLKEILAMRLRK